MISSQEEYDKELKLYLNKVKELSKPKNLIKSDTYKNFISLLEDAEKIGLFPHDYVLEQKQKIISGMNNIQLKEKLKRKFHL